VDFRLDRRVISVTSFARDARENRNLSEWRRRPAAIGAFGFQLRQ
jgi:hypothetical protein